jgi:hypothetical protein
MPCRPVPAMPWSSAAIAAWRLKAELIFESSDALATGAAVIIRTDDTAANESRSFLRF